MGITKTVGDRKSKECRELAKEVAVNTNSNPKKNRRKQKKMSAIQQLFETCKEVFVNSGTNVIPPPEDINRIRTVLDGMRPANVGLHPQMPYFKTTGARRTPKITYLHLHECDKFSMGIFCLPPSGVIPLHNHPGMTVFSKLLFGTMHIRSYDWVGDASSNTSDVTPRQVQFPEVRLAKRKVNANFTAPCNTSILYPADGGNMHCFTAVTACAVLDVLGPPYSDPDGRHCAYYFDHPFANVTVDGVSVPEEEREDYAWLQERVITPEDFDVVGAEYIGPRIVGN